MTPDEEVELASIEYNAAIREAIHCQKRLEACNQAVVEKAEAYGRAVGARDGGNYS